MRVRECYDLSNLNNGLDRGLLSDLSDLGYSQRLMDFFGSPLYSRFPPTTLVAADGKDGNATVGESTLIRKFSSHHKDNEATQWLNSLTVPLSVLVITHTFDHDYLIDQPWQLLMHLPILRIIWHRPNIGQAGCLGFLGSYRPHSVCQH